MQRILGFGAAILAAGLVVGFAVSVPTFAAKPEAKGSFQRSSEAPALVQAALEAEAAGDTAGRATLLAKARDSDPDFAPAR